MVLQHLAEAGVGARGGAVLDDREGLVELVGQVLEQVRQRGHPAPRRADADELVRHRSFRYSLSPASRTSKLSSCGLNRIDSRRPSASTPRCPRLS